MRPASEAEKARLNEPFAALCRIPSPFGREAGVAAHVRGELEALGLAVEAGRARATCSRASAAAPTRTVLLCAHLDTVEVHGAIEPVVVDGGWENAHDAILGADNKAAVAVFLEVARRASVEGSPVGVELLLTVEEEDALAGAKAFDASVLRADVRLRLRPRDADRRDRRSPRRPTTGSSADFHGRAAHAGIRPEDGRSAVLAAAHAIAAMPHGRIDEQTTANVGSIHGGVGSTNVVARALPRCSPRRARSIPTRVEAVVARMIDAAPRRRARTASATSTSSCEKLFDGYRTKAHGAGGRRRRGRAARLRLRARADRHRRRLGRQRAARSRASRA